MRIDSSLMVAANLLRSESMGDELNGLRSFINTISSSQISFQDDSLPFFLQPRPRIGTSLVPIPDELTYHVGKLSFSRCLRPHHRIQADFDDSIVLTTSHDLSPDAWELVLASHATRFGIASSTHATWKVVKKYPIQTEETWIR